MSKFGGMTPYPRKYGGQRPRVQILLESLNADRGDGYDATNRETVVYVENMAIARAISAAWGTNERLNNLWVATRHCQCTLERWERILTLSPKPDDTLTDRRRRVQRLNQYQHAAINGYLTEILESELGDAFVGIEYIPYSSATITVPDGTYPWGTANTSNPWTSTVANILVRLQKPSGWSELDFYSAAARVFPLLDPVVPAWATFEWYRAGPVSAAIPDGPTAAGFYLDDDANLDNQILD